MHIILEELSIERDWDEIKDLTIVENIDIEDTLTSFKDHTVGEHVSTIKSSLNREKKWKWKKT